MNQTLPLFSSPPAVTDPDVIAADMPDLPPAARLTPAMERAASEAGSFVERLADHVVQVAGTLPRDMAVAGALVVLSIAVARRVVLLTPFDDLYPIIWALWVAPSTVFHKTTALNVLLGLIRDTMPHLLLPQSSTNGRLLQNLAGQLPPNHDEFLPWDQEQWRRSVLFAGQRGLVQDEASRLFGDFGQSFNRGMLETFLKAYDCEPLLIHETNKHGVVYLRNLYLPILGATTPASLKAANTVTLWQSGFWPRWAVFVPDRLFPERQSQALLRVPRPPELEAALRGLLERLPEPAPASDNPQTPPAPPPCQITTIDNEAWEHWLDYNDAMLYGFQNPQVVGDDRLRLVCGRLPVKLLRIATLLATMDSQPGPAGPRITLAQYARAHQIAESWRLNAWRFVELMDHAQGGDDREQRLLTILHTLAATNTPATERELHRRSHWDRSKVEAVLRQLEKDGLVVSRPTKTKRTVEWKLV